MTMRKSHMILRTLMTVVLGVGALTTMACGGQMPFNGQINVAGDPPPVKAPEKPKRVELKADKIQINEKIQFELAKADIKSESHSLLDEVVQVIKDNPQIKKLAIEGHASSDGDDAFNKKLSDDRAKAVREYFTSHGIAKDRLTAEGFGEEKPIASNDTEEGRVENRRVEFNITEQDAKKPAAE